MLETRASLPVDTEEFMFGDDAEADAFIYCLYADLCAGRVTPALFMQLLESAETYPDAVSRLVRLAEHMPRGGRARRIFIHLDRVSPTDSFVDLGNRVCTFHNYFQPALVLLRHGALDPLAVLRVGGELLAEHGFTPDALVASYADLTRRGQISGAEALRLLTYLSSADDSTFGAAATPLRRFAEQLDRDPSRQAREPAERDDALPRSTTWRSSRRIGDPCEGREASLDGKESAARGLNHWSRIGTIREGRTTPSSLGSPSNRCASPACPSRHPS